VQISRIFLETAENEKEHAKRLFKFLSGGEVEVAAAFPAGAIGDTASNLKASAMGENHEHTTMYLGFTETADEEGFAQIAGVFRSIAVAEKQHEKRYLTLLANIENDRVFKRDGPVTWKCGNCGYIHEGAAAPETCPACAHPRAYFEPLGENY
jgi:rubrerythrin